MEWLLNRRRFMARHAEEEWVDKGYLTFLAEEAGTFSFYIGANRTAEQVTSVSYSLDNGKTWVTTANTAGTAQTITTPVVNAGKRIIWKGIATRYGEGRADYLRVNNFRSTGRFSAYGNIMSMLYGDNFQTDTFPEGSTFTFNGMFWACTGLTDISGLVFPNSTAYGCYQTMFSGCTNLTKVVTTLPSTSLSGACYLRMYEGCTSLTTASTLPATTLAGNCYQYMYQNCTSLTTASILPALTVSQYAYAYMYYGCSSLNSVTMYATKISATNAVNNMLTGVAATGTFYKNAAATWANSKCIPSGWTVETVNV